MGRQLLPLKCRGFSDCLPLLLTLSPSLSLCLSRMQIPLPIRHLSGFGIPAPTFSSKTFQKSAQCIFKRTSMQIGGCTQVNISKVRTRHERNKKEMLVIISHEKGAMVTWAYNFIQVIQHVLAYCPIWNSSWRDEGLVIVASFNGGSLLQSPPEMATNRQKKILA